MNTITETIKELWNVTPLVYGKTEAVAGQVLRAYAGTPDWLDPDDNITTVNLTKTICSEVARLSLLGTKVDVSGSARAEYLQRIIDSTYYQLRKWQEYAAVVGTVIIKPNGKDFDIVLPGEFVITDIYNGNIWGAVFISKDTDETGKVHYTRLEYHRFTGDKEYTVSNAAFSGDSDGDCRRHLDIKNSPWSMLDEEKTISNVTAPLFGVLQMPSANSVDAGCPLALPVTADAMQELHDLDIAYSRYVDEIDQSKRTVLLDSDRLFADGGSLKNKNTRIGSLDNARASMGLPEYVKAINGTGEGNIYTEINPSLNSTTRIEGINQLLRQIGYKCGFSNGYFNFDEAQGFQTATGVEASTQRTVQFVKDCRDMVEKAIRDIVRACSVFADVYNLAPAGAYELVTSFGDITYNEDEDRARWLSYVSMGKVPFWRYLVKFEGMSEDEAKAMEAEANPAQNDLTSLFSTNA